MWKCENITIILAWELYISCFSAFFLPSWHYPQNIRNGRRFILNFRNINFSSFFRVTRKISQCDTHTHTHTHTHTYIHTQLLYTCKYSKSVAFRRQHSFLKYFFLAQILERLCLELSNSWFEYPWFYFCFYLLLLFSILFIVKMCLYRSFYVLQN